MGRWMSPDWAASVSPVPWANLADPQTLNLYVYVRNNPLSLVDDDGHNWFTDFAGGLVDSTYRPIVHIVEHPIATAEGIGSAVAHPISKGQAIGNAVAGTVVAAAHGDGRAIGKIVGTVGTAVAGGAIARGVGVAGEVGAEAGSSLVRAHRLLQLSSTGRSMLLSWRASRVLVSSYVLQTERCTKASLIHQRELNSSVLSSRAMGGPSTTVVRETAPTDLVQGSPVHSAATEGPGRLIHVDNLPQVKPQ
jgi:hypothetical protein